MILNRFFKPKWQHADPQVRKLALQALSASDPALAKAAREDQNPGVRRAVLYRLTDLDLLRQIAREDPEAGVRETADARFRKLMTGHEPDSPELEVRLAILAQPLSPGLADFLAVHAAEPELRLAALPQVEQAALLGEVASNDPVAEVRFAALERICEESILKQVAKQTRNRDKRLSRHARERLDSLQGERQRTLRSAQLCAEMESLAKDRTTEPNAGHFQRLEKEWDKQQSAADSDLQKRYHQAREAFLSRLHQSVSRRKKRLELCHCLEDLLERLQFETELTPTLAAVIQNALQGTRRDWLESGTSAKDEEQRFLQIAQAVTDRERVLYRNHERAERLRELLYKANELLNQASAVSERDLSALTHQWGGLERPEAKALMADLQGQFDTLLEQLRLHLQRQAEQRDQQWTAIQTLVSDLEAALAEGALQQAISLHDQARQHLKHPIGLTRAQMADLEERLQDCATKVGKLRGWRRWGTHRAREGLCEEVERLVDSAQEPAEIARQIKAARAAWKALDSTEGAAPKALWERFNRVCERAYQPCQAYFDAQAQQRQENLEEKQALCDYLERFEASTDWDQVDWRAVERTRREVHSRWGKLGPVSREEKKGLDRRYKKALQRLDARLTQERERDLRRRQALIERVQGLADSDDLRSAIEATKRAQAEWQPTVLASRREEQALWRAFRSACDALFARRQAEQQTADHARQANLACKTALCEEVEALALTAGEAIARARGRIQQAQQAWEAIGAVPRPAYKEIEQRFAAACERFEQRCREQTQADERQELQNLHSKARLCTQLEALLSAQDPREAIDLIAQARQAWADLPPLRMPLETAIQDRFAKVCQALTEPGEARQALIQTLQENLEYKQQLCLRMEILAGVDTPSEFAQARMEYQVARLSESLVERHVLPVEQSVVNERHKIEQDWCLTGTLSLESEEALEARFQRALAALSKGQDGEGRPHFT